MKKINILYMCLVILASCGSDDEPKNTAPTTPTLSNPTNNLVCINNIVLFNWAGSNDAEKDVITYQLEIATDNGFTKDLISFTTTGLSKEVTLAKGKYYYWRLKALDDKNNSSEYTTVYKFYTEMNGVLNHLPYAPVLTAPTLSSSINTNSVSLSWTAVDPDNDSLVYDVYFGTVNTPTQKVASDLSTASYEVSSLSPGTKYYWNIVVKDGKGGTTVGQVWSFSRQ